MRIATPFPRARDGSGALVLIDDADRPAKWYFALKANLIESRRAGTKMVHPMDGPVTLRWRS